MAALRRGIAHYQGGTESVSPTESVPVSTPLTTPPPASALPTPSSPPPPGNPGTLGRMGEMVTGRFGDVVKDPNASPFMSWLANINQAAQTDQRAQQLTRGPSLVEKAWTGLFGNQATDWPALQQREETAQTISHPVAQRYLRENPAALAIAEKDPAQFATHFKTTLQEELQRAVDNQKTAAANPKVETQDEHDRTVAAAQRAGVDANTAHVAVSPQKYSVDDFVNTFKGIPTATFMQLFGNQLGHVQTPQEKAATEFFDQMHGRYADLNEQVKKMEKEDAEAVANKKPKIHDVYKLPFTGPNAYDAAKAERDKAMAATMNALQKFISPQSFPTN